MHFFVWDFHRPDLEVETQDEDEVIQLIVRSQLNVVNNLLT